MSYELMAFDERLVFGIPSSYVGVSGDGKTKCGNVVSTENVRVATILLEAIQSGAKTTYIDEWIRDLAVLCLCGRRHHDQKSTVVNLWTLDVRAFGILDSTKRPSSTQNRTAQSAATIVADIPHASAQEFRKMKESLRIMEAQLDQTRAIHGFAQKTAERYLRVLERSNKDYAALQRLTEDHFQKNDVMESNTFLRIELVAAEDQAKTHQHENKLQEDQEARLYNELEESYAANSKLQNEISNLDENLRAAQVENSVSHRRITDIEEKLETSILDNSSVRHRLSTDRKQMTSLSVANAGLRYSNRGECRAEKMHVGPRDEIHRNQQHN
ncbi:hypothetical protein E4T42_06859 [Aureobasidium subglaciale]|nr:hypothetical protein E4T42_06859 [Aureobasidium subglaciale]